MPPPAPTSATPSTDEEVSCTLYLIHSGSRRIVANHTNGQSLTWLLQVPTKAGYNSIPNSVSAPKTACDQLSVSYLNADKTLAMMPNGSTIHLQSAANMNDIRMFPEHVSADMLQVNLIGISASSSVNALEIHLIICYEPISQGQVRTSD